MDVQFDDEFDAEENWECESDIESEDEIMQTPAPQVNVLDPPGNPPRQWSRQVPTNMPTIPFSLNPGLTVDPSTLQSPRDYLDLFLNSELLQQIETQTNIYAEFIKSNSTRPKALIKKWKPINVDQLRTFLGLLFHMGTIQLSTMSDYWNRDPVLFDIGCFPRVMSRDKFVGILQCLHFAQNPGPDEPRPADVLYKVRPLIDIFHQTVDRLIIPTKNLSIDESVVLWRGRLIKPTPMG